MAEAEVTVPRPLPITTPERGTLFSLPRRKTGETPPAASEAARREPRTLWYALYFPQLEALSSLQQKKHLSRLAALAQDVSSTVSMHSCALVLEVRSSLKYFRGMAALHERLQAQIAGQLQEWQLPETFHYAASPAITGSLLLARGGCNRLVHRRSNLRAALGQLPVKVLHLDKEPARRLHNMGIRCLRDLWRLPTDGLRRRFGSEFVNQLNRALGKAPEPIDKYQPPPSFTSSYDLPYEVEDLTRLLPVADEMLAQLCDFLQRRDLATSQLLFSLRHEQQHQTTVTLGLRRPGRDRKHLMLLLETHLARLTLPAPVTGLRLSVEKFDAFTGRNELLFRESAAHPPRGQADNLPADADRLGENFAASPEFIAFIEHLQARLGEDSLKSIHPLAEHCPEYAVELRGHEAPGTNGLYCRAPENPRPLWLLPVPQELTLRHGKLYHHYPLQILSGPERIESRWWSGTDIRRDYYVARQERGSRLWIYHEKTGAKRWLLHGLFA